VLPEGNAEPDNIFSGRLVCQVYDFPRDFGLVYGVYRASRSNTHRNCFRPGRKLIVLVQRSISHKDHEMLHQKKKKRSTNPRLI
jgi:hypothetical protein